MRWFKRGSNSEVSKVKVTFEGQPIELHSKDIETLQKASDLLTGTQLRSAQDTAQDLSPDEFLKLLAYYITGPHILTENPVFDLEQDFRLIQLGLLEKDSRERFDCGRITKKGSFLLNLVTKLDQIEEGSKKITNEPGAMKWYTLEGRGRFPIWPLIFTPLVCRLRGDSIIDLYAQHPPKDVNWSEIEAFVEEYALLYPFLPDIIERAKFEYKIRFLVFPDTGSPDYDTYRAFKEQQEANNAS